MKILRGIAGNLLSSMGAVSPFPVAEERADNFRIVTAHPCHSADRQYQYRQIQAAGQDIVGKRHTIGAIAYQKQVFQFYGILLQQQEDA